MTRFRLTIDFEDAHPGVMSLMASAQGLGLATRLEPLDISVPPSAATAPVTHSVTQQPSPPPKKAAGVTDPWGSLMKLCNENQLRVLELVKGAPAGITSHEMAKTMGVAVTKINGYINGGLLRNLPKAGLDIEDVLVVSKSGTTTYRPGRLLLTKAISRGGAAVG